MTDLLQLHVQKLPIKWSTLAVFGTIALGVFTGAGLLFCIPKGEKGCYSFVDPDEQTTM